MIDLALAFVTALLLGMRHATDADHIVAVSAIASRERSVRKASMVGAAWGVGHTLTIFAVGGAIVLFRVAFTPRLGLSLEFTVAMMLVLLGALNLLDVRVGGGSSSHARPFVVGVVHGLAGSAAATLLVLPLIADPRWAVAYLMVFGVGTIAGMTMVTLAIAAPAALAAARVAGFQRWLRLASGTISLAFGTWLMAHIGFVDGLFGAAPRWTPR